MGLGIVDEFSELLVHVSASNARQEVEVKLTVVSYSTVMVDICGLDDLLYEIVGILEGWEVACQISDFLEMLV